MAENTFAMGESKAGLAGQKQQQKAAATTWEQGLVTFIQGLKKPTPVQQLLLDLHKLPTRTADQQRKLNALLKAERAAYKAASARAAVNTMLSAEKRAQAVLERKARDHEMYQVAGLVSLAGLLDTATGIPHWDRAELLGALMSLAAVPADDQRRSAWKAKGTVKLSQAT